MQKAMYYEELAHTIVEAKKPLSVLFISWRPRRTDGVVPVQSQRPKNQRSWCEFEDPKTKGPMALSPCQSPKVREPGALVFKGRRSISQLIFLLLSVTFGL